MTIRNVPESWLKLYNKTQSGKTSPRQAIKMFCGECMGYDRTQIPKCPDNGCPLYKHRPKFKERKHKIPETASTEQF
jgi:hypothetical protein